MPTSASRSLFIQIGGSASDLTIAAKAGKSALLELGDSADDVQATVRGAFEKLGGNVADQAKAMEDAYSRTFANIRATAQSALKAPTSAGAGVVLDLSAARQEAGQAQASAEFLRTLADAQARLVDSGAEASAGAKSLAVSLELQAIAAEKSALAATEAVGGLERLAAESGIATDDLAKLAERQSEAAAAALAQAAAQEQLAARAERLLAATDPVAAAQQRYNTTVAEAASLLTEGAISAERYAQAEGVAAAALREVADAAGIAAEKQQALYATQAAAARVEVKGNQAQDAIAAAEQITLANKSAADSFAFFEKVGLAEAQSISVFETATVQSVIAGSERIALANKSAAASFDVFRQAGIEEAQGAAEIVGGHARIGASGLIAEHVVRSFSDSITAGQSPVRAFALELPRAAEALQFFAQESNVSEGALGKFAGFMGGPWGRALTLGVSLLAPLVAGLIEGAGASDSMHGKVMDLVSALNDEAGATTKAQKALADYNAEKQRARDQDAQSTQATLDKAKADLQAAIATRAALQAEAQRYFTQQTNSPTGGAAAAFAGLALSRQADAQTPQIATLQQSIRNIDIDQAKEAAKAAANPIDAIREKYKLLADAAEAAAAKNDKLAGSLKGTLTANALAEAAAIKAEQAREEAQRRSAADNRQVGRQINISQAEDIVHGIGGTVTSAQRSTAKQAELYAAYQNGTGSLAAKPGTSLHETGQALDVAKTAGISLGALKKAFEDAGVHLTEALDEGNHYHVGFGPKGARGPSADTLARRQLAAADKGVNQDGAFESELRSATDAVGAARDKLPQTADQRYATDAGKADDDFIQRDAGLADKVGAGKLTAANALVLEQLYAQLADLQKQGAAITRDTAISDQRFALDAAALDAQQELLKLDEQIAPNREARLKLEQQILAGQQQAYRAQLDRDIANARTNPEAAQKAVIAYQSLDKREAGQNADLARQYASPGQSFVKQLDSTSLNDSLQGAAVQGLGHLSDGLEGVIDGTKSVSAAFSEMGRSIIADLVKIAVQQAIIKPLATSLFGGTGGGGGGFGSILESLGIGRGSASAVTSAGAASDDSSFLSILGLADGGSVAGPGTARSDSIPAMLSHGEFVVNAGSAGKHLTLLRAINDNKVSRFADGGYVGSVTGGLPAPARLSTTDMQAVQRPGNVTNHYDLRGALVDKDVYADMHKIADAHVQLHKPATVAAGAALAAQNAGRSRRRALG